MTGVLTLFGETHLQEALQKAFVKNDLIFEAENAVTSVQLLSYAEQNAQKTDVVIIAASAVTLSSIFDLIDDIRSIKESMRIIVILNGGREQYLILKPLNIEQQGYPFFAGEMVLETELDIEGENPVLELDIKGINAVKIKIGDTEKVMLTDNRLPLSDFGVNGRVKTEITLINNLRNMLGPHHLKEGESYFVGPWSFFKEKCIWASNPEKDWNDNYCFAQMSICNKKKR